MVEVYMNKMKLIICLSFLFFLLISDYCAVYGVSGILLGIDVKEGIPADSSSFKLIDRREIKLYNGLETASFQANFTLTTTATVMDSENV